MRSFVTAPCFGEVTRLRERKNWAGHVIFMQVSDMSKNLQNNQHEKGSFESSLGSNNTRIPSSELKEPSNIVNRRLSFALDEASLSHLKSQKMPLDQSSATATQKDETPEDEEEEMFFLDEEMSEEDRELNNNHEEDETTDQDKKISPYKNPISASFKQSVFEMDKKYPWVKKKRDTSKYLAQDFEIKKGPKDLDTSSAEDTAISMFATSVPITINYPFIEKEEEKDEEDIEHESQKKKDILAKSFANYDFSFSDRLLSEQFPVPNRRRSHIPGSSSLINPQLHSLVGKSLDTRGNAKKAISQLRPKDEDEDFDSSVPPHIWAAKEADEDDFEDHSYKSKG